MEGAAVDKIADLASKPMPFGDLIALPPDWQIKHAGALLEPPSVDTLRVHTLSAVAEYLISNRDKLILRDLTVVVNATAVDVYGPVLWQPDDAIRGKRLQHLHAEPQTPVDPAFFGRFGAPEDLICGVQQIVAEDTERTRLLRLLSNLKQEDVRISTDDGVSQTVTAKSGIATVANEVVWNPFQLRVLRSFPEIDPLPEPLLLRFKSRPNAIPDAALFSVFPNAWKAAVAREVKAWLDARIPDDVSVLA